MPRDLLCPAPLKPKHDGIIFFSVGQYAQGEKLNGSQREYAWQGGADDLIWICVVIN